jgi:hypothetical protein
MGTRGTIGFIVGEKEKLAYNHFDSYPEGLGLKTLAFLREFPGLIGELRRQAMRLEVVSDAVPPSAEQIKELKEFSDLNVGNQTEDDWYCLLRHTQGDWQATLDAGFMEDGGRFPEDSLFCEWAYVINLDDEVLEVYRGFQQKKHNKGRFAKRGGPYTPDYEGAPTWWPVALIATYPLNDLPSDEDFINRIDPPDGHTERWSYSAYGVDAEKLRNARTRELRSFGCKVKCSKWDFQDLARDVVWQLEVTW